MKFEKLQIMHTQNNMLRWVAATEPEDSMQSAYLSHDLELAKAHEEFAKENPDHIVNKVCPVYPLEFEERNSATTNALWSKYMEHRTEQTEPSEEYFDLFDQTIDLTKEGMALMGYSSPIQNHEYNFADAKVLLDVVAKMAKIAKETIDSNIKNRQKPVKKFKVADIHNMLIPFNPIVYYRISKENGSFMTGISENTTRIHIKESDPNDMHSSASHELGHALYQLKFLNKYTSVGKIGGCHSLSLHESSSIFHETILSGIDFNVTPQHPMNLRRLTADRLHYILHIYIRLQIEHDIFVNGLRAREIPQRWNELMQEYFGIVPSNAHEGFMQDVHWNDGSFGYFHSYAIGLLTAWTMAARVKDQIEALGDNPDTTMLITDVILPEIEKTYGTFDETVENMFEKVHPDIDASLSSFEKFVKENFNIKKRHFTKQS